MNFLYNAIFLASLCACAFHLDAKAHRRSAEGVFTNKYKYRTWGANDQGKGTSGIGSTLPNTELYRELLQDFLESFDIKTVVDVGCGDWEFSQAIDWTGINYIGFDIVKPVIKRNIAKYGTSNIIFKHGNAIEMDLPQADLLICKDVLQHLPNEDILKFIQQLGKFKYCLITNDVNPVTLSSDNPEIKHGEDHYLDLSKPPFSLRGVKLIDYWCVVTHKLVFFIDNNLPD